MQARIVLVYEEEREAKAVSEAISPDNVRTPDNLSIKTFRAGKKVETSIDYDGENLMVVLSTVDDLLNCVSIAEKVALTTKKMP